MTVTPSTAAMLDASDLVSQHFPDADRVLRARLNALLASALDAKERLIADKDAENARLRSALERLETSTAHVLVPCGNWSRDDYANEISFRCSIARTALQTTKQETT